MLEEKLGNFFRRKLTKKKAIEHNINPQSFRKTGTKKFLKTSENLGFDSSRQAKTKKSQKTSGATVPLITFMSKFLLLRSWHTIIYFPIFLNEKDPLVPLIFMLHYFGIIPGYMQYRVT